MCNNSSEADPALLTQCGDFFLAHGQNEKAAQLFLSAKDYGKVVLLYRLSCDGNCF